MSDNYSNNNWMASTPAIDKLSLSELSLPGTHNAGSDTKATYAIFPGKLFLACQYDSFYEQLSHGSRALDLRLACLSKKEGIERFRFRHNQYLSSRSLLDLVFQVREFLILNPDEFIILDFHELANSEGPFNFKQFKAYMEEWLGPRIIPRKNAHLSLGELKRINSLQRILVAAPAHPDLDSELFTRQISHRWDGDASKGAYTLKKYIQEVVNDPPGQWSPWSLSSAVWKFPGPKHIYEHLDLWFDPAKNNWAAQCNIINVDFMEDSKIVEHCRAANLVKAQR